MILTPRLIDYMNIVLGIQTIIDAHDGDKEAISADERISEYSRLLNDRFFALNEDELETLASLEGGLEAARETLAKAYVETLSSLGGPFVIGHNCDECELEPIMRAHNESQKSPNRD